MPCKVLFVISSIGFLDHLSIPTLSSCLKAAGHEVRCIVYNDGSEEAVRRCAEYAPDIVAYSISSTEAEEYLRINAKLKEAHSFLAVFGGPHTTFFPDFIKAEGVDAICRGEGEVAFPKLCSLLGSPEQYTVHNFSFKLPGGEIVVNPIADLIEDLNSLPFPDRDVIYEHSKFLRLNPVKAFFAGRGCPFNCSYCFNHAYNALYKGKGRIVRTKTVDYLIAEIRAIRKCYPLSFIKIHDDVFGVDKQWLQEFADKYPKQIGLPFLCYARPNMISDDYCKQLKRAGCHAVCIAIESGSERIRREVLNRKMTNAQIITACMLLKANSLKVYSLNMIGLPTEQEGDALETVRLNREAGVDYADASIFQPYPGTRITQFCKDVGALESGVEHFKSQFSETILNFKPECKRRIRLMHRLFPILVDYGFGIRLYEFMARRGMHLACDLIYRFYYGYFLHKRIYAGSIPLKVRGIGAASVLFSRNRT